MAVDSEASKAAKSSSFNKLGGMSSLLNTIQKQQKAPKNESCKLSKGEKKALSQQQEMERI